jgi:A/G-specific adenine glycosylase
MSTSTDKIEEFRKAIWDYYRLEGRRLLWRDTDDPYAILVSEVMLQQTQVSRVIEKYDEWLKKFPDIESLAAASLSEVLRLWSGLGYNRRGKWLREAALAIRDEYGGRVPAEAEKLDALPGIGPYTSKAIAAFAFGQPEVFIETNIRRVFIHFFFSDRAKDLKVSDKEIEPLVAESLDRRDIRNWYYALMDYGAGLVKYIENPNKRSAHYSVQAPLKGSNREARGAALKSLSCGRMSLDELARRSGISSERLEKALGGMVAEGIVLKKDEYWEINE